MIKLDLPNADFFSKEDFLPSQEADDLLNYFLQKPEEYWSQNRIKIFGKEYDVPRKERFCTFTEELEYSYSGKTMISNVWDPALNGLIHRFESMGLEFNAVLINYYRDGNDSNGWHADNEKELGENPVIASVSLGAERRFQLKSLDKTNKETIVLTHGSMLLMGENSQINYKHQLPKMPKLADPRINLTFRKVFKHD